MMINEMVNQLSQMTTTSQAIIQIY